MKRIFAEIISVFLVLGLLFSGVSVAFATEYVVKNEFTPVYCNSTPSWYFSHLLLNYPSNTEGTCAYVAISLLLSYYDSFWRDDFIPEAYDATGKYEIASNSDERKIEFTQSPGTACEALDPNFNTMDYDAFIEYGKEFYLQFKLIDIAKNHFGFLDGDLNDLEQSIVEKEDSAYGLTVSELISVLDYYLYDYVGFSEEQISINTMSQSEVGSTAVRNKIVENVLAGVPIIYCGFDSEARGHGMIAYDYDAVNDEIYFHSGWSSTNRIIGESEHSFNNNISIIWLEIDEELLGHVCASNYQDKNGDTVLCMCKFAIHPYHTHTITGYSNCTSTEHTRECLLCDGETEAHKMAYQSISETEHSFVCSDCGYSSLTEAHSTTCSSLSATQHCHSCDTCDYELIESHSFGAMSYTARGHERTCLECGYLKVIAHTYVMNDSGQRVCSLCGRVGAINSSNDKLLE